MRTTERDRGVRTIRGTVNGAGAIVNSGAGDYNVVKTSTGVYSIRWSPRLRATPVATVVPDWASAALATAETYPEQFIARTYNAVGAPADVTFNFTLTGIPA